jgi:hypothetical protein
LHTLSPAYITILTKIKRIKISPIVIIHNTPIILTEEPEVTDLTISDKTTSLKTKAQVDLPRPKKKTKWASELEECEYHKLSSRLIPMREPTRELRQGLQRRIFPLPSPEVFRHSESKQNAPPRNSSTQTVRNQSALRTLAASTASEEEEASAKYLQEQGLKPVLMDKRPYRPKMSSVYVEPEYIPDSSDSLDILFKEFGNALFKTPGELPPRDDVTLYDPVLHDAQFSKNIQWRRCPEEYKERITTILKQFWDVFDEAGMQKPIRGYEFHIDTGAIPPISCKPPRYGAHESRVINGLIKILDGKNLTEDDFGPWGALVVLAQKPNQEHLHWFDYIFRFCVSYRLLNAATRPFVFPTRRCDDAANSISGRYFIIMDLDCGYWQIRLTKASKEKTGFFVPNGKKHWNVMPMGACNSHPAFVAMMAKFQTLWDKLATDRGIIILTLERLGTNPGSEVIVDDLFLYADDPEALFAYFMCVLEVLQHQRCTVKLKKCRFFEPDAEFVGIDITPEGNKPAQSKEEAFRTMTRPLTFTDLRMIIGMHGFYQNHMPLFEWRIRRWREHLKKAPKPGMEEYEEEKRQLNTIWESEDDEIFETLKTEILEGPLLQRPNSQKRFYLKTDWCKDGFGAVLLQTDNSTEALAAESRETSGGKCEFDLTLSGLRLMPICFISRATKPKEKSYHATLGEPAVGVWAIEKFKHWLFGKEFTWLTDCFRLKTFFQSEDLPSHVAQRWRLQMLRYNFTIEHRPARMLWEADTLSRYNRWTDQWRTEYQEKPTEMITATMIATVKHDIAFSHEPIQIVGPALAPKTDQARVADTTRSIIVVNAGLSTAKQAIKDAGIECFIVAEADTKFLEQDKIQSLAQLALESENTIPVPSPEIVDWIIAETDTTWTKVEEEYLVRTILSSAKNRLLRAAILFVHDPGTNIRPSIATRLIETAETINFEVLCFKVHNERFGGTIEKMHYCILMTESDTILENFKLDGFPDPRPQGMIECLDESQNILDDFTWPSELRQVMENRPTHHDGLGFPDPSRANSILSVQAHGESDHVPMYNIDFPAPKLGNPRNRFCKCEFGIAVNDEIYGPAFRGIRPHELLQLHGFSNEDARQLLLHEDYEDVMERLLTTVPRQSMQAITAALFLAEQKTGRSVNTDVDETNVLRVLSAFEINQTMTIPLPTSAQWKSSTAEDPELAVLIPILSLPREEQTLNRHTIGAQYHEAWADDRLELENGIIYYYERPKRARMKQIRSKVVPKTLRRTIINACHSSPMSGHTGIHKTYYRVITRYWWPRVNSDVTEAVRACAHCKLANATSHEAQQMLHTMETDEPFDVIVLDVWSPGAVPSSSKEIKVLTCLDTMTGFANAALITQETSQELAKTTFHHFFVPNGLPRLVIFDEAGSFAGKFKQMCEYLTIPYHAVSPENHKAIMCERFHRYLNKVQKIHRADCESPDQWTMGTLFSLYAWNASPIDGTNIIRSYAARGREFPFPIDVHEAPHTNRDHSSFSQQAMEHIESAFPLLFKQRELLTILNDERRTRHRELKDRSKTMKIFQPGDLVIVRKQTATTDADGVSNKLVFKTKGPYRVIEQATNDGSYWIHKVPFVLGAGRIGKRRKEMASRMEAIPDTLILHQQADGIDTRLAAIEGPMVSNPLEKYIGAFRFGKYQKADNVDFAFERVEDLWRIDIDADDDDDDDYQPSEADASEQDDDLEFDDDPTPSLSPFETAQTDLEYDLPDSPFADTSEGTEHDTQHDTEGAELETQHDTEGTEQEPEQETELSTATSRHSGRRKTVPLKLRTHQPLYDESTYVYERLFRRIESSRDKIMIIRHRPPGQDEYTWSLVQVDLDETDQKTAKTNGIYRVKWYTRHQIDSMTIPVKRCRYWPRIHSRKSDGSLGKFQFLRPQKVGQVLKNQPHLYGWYQQNLNLHEETIHGPFNFERRHNDIAYTISEHEWTKFRQLALAHQVDTEHLDLILPISG